MDISEDVIARLERAATYGYHRGARDATEPVALSAIALLAVDRPSRAAPLLDWLAEHQSGDGSLGVDAENPTPCWPTAWAVLAWQQANSSRTAGPRFATAVDAALAWMLAAAGEVIERVDTTGHDTTILGWPWVTGTHAWAEPTAMNLLALRHAGRADHPRAREATRLLHDRMLPHGGCNYGNTIVFGQELRPHVEPTGLSLLALAGWHAPDDRVQKSIEYLQRELSARSTTASLCYGLLGLAAQDQRPVDADAWLDAASQRTLARDAAPYKLALLTLARLGTAAPLLPASQQAVLP